MSRVPTSSLDSPGTRPFDAEQAHDGEWALRDPLRSLMSLWFGDRCKLIPWLQKRLGKQTRCVNHDKRRWYVWDDPKYILYAHGGTCSLDLDVPDGCTQLQAAEAFMWDVGYLKKTLTRAEHDGYVLQGSKAAEPHVEVFRDYTPAELKEFVLGYCDGQIYCDFQCRNTDLNMVFMVLIFGALHTRGPDEKKGTPGSPAWLAEQELAPHPGDAPAREYRPPIPERAECPRAPEPQSMLVPDEVTVEALSGRDDTDVRVAGVGDLFTEGPLLGLAAYHDELRLNNEARTAAHQAALVKWEAAKTKIDTDHQVELVEHAAEVAAWEKSEAEFDVRTTAWERQKAIHKAAHHGFTATRLQNLGVIYEEISKAGPRSVNGQPIFMSCRILNRSDWIRCRAAINRELARRDEMEI